MATLKDILYGVSLRQVVGPTDIEISRLHTDSRKVDAGDCFVAIRGIRTDGHRYMDQVLEQGAFAIICEVLPAEMSEEVTYVRVENSSKALGIMASNYYGNPSEKMKLVGVTGTNGKTSTVTLLFDLFRKAGYKAGLISTVENKVNEEVIPAVYTTPDAISLNRLMKHMADSGCEYCFMEVSSHAIDQNRIEGLRYIGGVFTNITHDHLDYHKTFDNYLKAKKNFFDQLAASAFALVNTDDRNGKVMLQNTRAQKQTYSLKAPSDFKAKLVSNTVEGLMMEFEGVEMHSRLVGEFNAYNLTAVYATARLLNMEKEECLTILSALTPPEGRFDQLFSPHDRIVGIIDYAHTPDALKNVLQTIHAVRNGNEKVLTVVGCGGDRDAAKRPVMAEIACRYSSQVVLTSDNPRSEDPEEILRQMNVGVPITDKRKVLTIADRREAIKTACTLANKGDIILIAGKGHEKYQEIDGERFPFDDKNILIELFKELGK